LLVGDLAHAGDGGPQQPRDLQRVRDRGDGAHAHQSLQIRETLASHATSVGRRAS
jgi:hypothetical protein